MARQPSPHAIVQAFLLRLKDDLGFRVTPSDSPSHHAFVNHCLRDVQGLFANAPTDAGGLTREALRDTLRSLNEATARLLAVDPEEARKALAALYEWAPGGWPAGYGSKRPKYAVKGDSEQPFFCEAYLYPLMGKEDARTILALLHHVAKAVGYTGV